MAASDVDRTIQPARRSGPVSDLGLNIVNLGGPGRPAKPLEAVVLRDLNTADLELAAATERHSQPPALKKITDRHHALARLLASGTKEGEAAMILGMDNSRVSILKNSPAFVELLDLYRSEVDREFATTLDHMAGLSRDALLELRERLEDNPDKFSNRELLSVIGDMSDRSDGAGSDAKLPTRIELVAQEVPASVTDGDKVVKEDSNG
jgi:hypothetical protein